MARSNFSGEDPNKNYSHRQDVERGRKQAMEQVKAGNAAGRAKRRV
jgi:hypothetical protein